MTTKHDAPDQDPDVERAVRLCRRVRRNARTAAGKLARLAELYEAFEEQAVTDPEFRRDLLRFAPLAARMVRTMADGVPVGVRLPHDDRE